MGVKKQMTLSICSKLRNVWNAVGVVRQDATLPTCAVGKEPWVRGTVMVKVKIEIV